MIEGGRILDAARDAASRRSWSEAVESFEQAAAEQTLSAEDLEVYADVAWWAGKPDLSIEMMEEAYSAFIAGGDNDRAASVAILLSELALRRGVMSVAAGWRSKVERLLADTPVSPNHARLRVFDIIQTLFSGDADGAVDLADEVIALARATGDSDSEAAAMVFKGRALVSRGDWDEGMRLVDESAATALSGSLGIRAASNVYCCTIEACRSVGDFRRAGEWTEEADRWMSRNSVAGYPGVCQIRRAELKRLRGAWSEAETETLRACENLERYRLIDEVGIGESQVGLIKLLMGDFEGAEDAFARAFEHGADPQPGLALLMLARGQADEAAESIAGSLSADMGWDLPTRMHTLPAQAHIAVVRGDFETGRVAVEELEKLAADHERPVFGAYASTVRGELELAEGRATDAKPFLVQAVRQWRELDFPYEMAQARALLGRAHLAGGDASRARMELNAARSTFEGLGATPALAEVDEVIGSMDRKTTEKDRAVRTFMFTDIVTSTDLIGVIGDQAWESLITWHDRELRSAFTAHGGVEANHVGDGFFVVFDSALAAIDSAVSIQRRLIDHRRDHGFAPSVRIGLHTGEATVDGGEYRGQDVHLAARVGSAAGGEEIVVSAATLAEAGIANYPVSEGRETILKGIAEPVMLHTIDWR